ncbi:MAG: hypothetical protein MJ183_03135 [Treponemataceae bacterium]|nr:hypothetical protein [Treponemataceae bacterium]
MNEIEKFRADVERIKKHERNDGLKYDGIKAARNAADLFVRNNKKAGELAKSVADYWMEKYIRNGDLNEVPTINDVDFLCDIQELFEGTLEGKSVLKPEDWNELREMVNLEAENLPIGMLTSLLSAVMDHGAL